MLHDFSMFCQLFVPGYLYRGSPGWLYSRDLASYIRFGLPFSYNNDKNESLPIGSVVEF